ncbi:wax ester/triacylglycerol synthase domain-containing protein [Rhodococcus erythropolis]|uniref:wax ester/triacylglycerol synthase domain-containing protein n=1 Tax=Rhodococcus erythropolis TaxID=1833 RepID=UPI0037919721
MDARDALFLYLERENVTQSFLTSFVFFPTEAGAPAPRREDIVEWLSERLEGLPMLRDRVIRVPFDLAVPRLCRDVEFDIGRHLVFHDVADWSSLRDVVPELIARRMDPEHPQWRIHVAQGVRGVMGRSDSATVVMMQFHHSIADGQESVRVAKHLFSSVPTHVNVALSPAVESVPSAAALAVRAAVSVPWVLVRFLWSLRTIAVGKRRVREEIARGDYTRGRAHASFAAPFTGALGERRRFDCMFLSFPEVKKVRSALGDVTVNDIFLAIVSLGLSYYLSEREWSTPYSLGGTVPVSIRGLGPAKTARNQFVVCGVDLHTDVSDPIERVRLIHDSAVDSIAAAKSPGNMLIFSALASVPGFVFKKSVALIGRRQHSNPVTSFHTSISSVPKGSGDWRLGDAQAVGCFGVISLEGIAGVGHTIDTLDDSATINITVDPDLFPDVERYRELLEVAWNDIRTAASPVAAEASVQ